MATLHEALLDSFQLLPLPDERLPEPQEAWRGLYQPTFHGPFVVELRRRGENGELSLYVAAPGFVSWWMTEQGLVGKRAAKGRPPPEGVRSWTAAVPAPALQVALRAFAEVDALALGDMATGQDRDGIALLGEVRRGPRSARFRARNPDRSHGPRHLGYFVALARLALAVEGVQPGHGAVIEGLGYLGEPRRPARAGP